MKTIAYHGIPGAFSHITALKEYGPNMEYLSCRSFREVFELVDKEKADYGIVPIENSLAGSIYENYDLLYKYNLSITAEHYTRIQHCLAATRNGLIDTRQRLNRIQKVMSHPKALEQCAQFFINHPWMEAVIHRDTARAAAEVAKQQDLGLAAICSSEAATLYGLDIIVSGIEDDQENYTRFIVISKHNEESITSNKCSLIMCLDHTPGSLAKILQMISKEQLNLSKIESRPLKGSAFEYIFYADIEFINRSSAEVEKTLELISQEVQSLKQIGFYKRGSLWTH